VNNLPETDETRQTEDKKEMLVGSLCELSLKGLVPMFDQDKKTFCYRVRKTKDGIIPDGESFRYAIITLLGLKRYEQHIGPTPISIPEVFNELLSKSSSIVYAGDAGLLLWLTAMVAPDRIGEVYSRLDITNKWKNYQDATKGMTTELSWLLTGLCYAMLKGSQSLPGITDTAVEVFNLVKGNYGGKGIFRHQHGKSIAGAFRGNIGCFADQVYPIYALTRFAVSHGHSDALTMARKCSDTICELQGNYGQWWWYYNAKTGRTAGRYPVFSVHQDGMAPMALFAASDVTGVAYDSPIYKGLDWITGKNELGIDMRDFTRNMIWRNFYLRKWKQNRKLELLTTMIGKNSDEILPPDMDVLYECRPYCLGWILYAFADKVGKQSTMHGPLN